jgi:predicted metal-dependent hydrolase
MTTELPPTALTSEILALPDGPALVEWRRSTRARRVSLRIDPCGGSVVVTLPPRAGRNAGMALLMDHAAWVSARLAALPGAIPFAAGARLPLYGVEHPIRPVPQRRELNRRGTIGRGESGRTMVWVENGEILVAGDPAALQRRVA